MTFPSTEVEPPPAVPEEVDETLFGDRLRKSAMPEKNLLLLRQFSVYPTMMNPMTH